MQAAVVIVALLAFLAAGLIFVGAIVAADRYRPKARQLTPVRPVRLNRDRPRATKRSYTLEEWQRPEFKWMIYERDGWRCHLCGGDVWRHQSDPTKVAQTDHVVPKSRGGSNVASNLRTACRRCNLLKGNYEDNEAIRRAIRAWRARTDQGVMWSPGMEVDLNLYVRLAGKGAFVGQMKKAGWSDNLVF